MPGTALCTDRAPAQRPIPKANKRKTWELSVNLGKMKDRKVTVFLTNSNLDVPKR